MAYVVPRFSGVYESTGRDLPWLSRLLLDWGTLVRTNALNVLVCSGVFCLGVIFAVSRSNVRLWIAARIWRIPALGEQLRVYQLARLFRAVAMLLKGGIPMVSALGMVQQLLRPALRAPLALAIAGIKEGQPTSHALNFARTDYTCRSEIIESRRAIGNMGEMMDALPTFMMKRWHGASSGARVSLSRS
jgi:general secretion pathway protein F